MDHHLDVFRVVFAQLVFADLVRIKEANGAETEKEDSLLVSILAGPARVGVMEYWSIGLS